MKVGIFGKSGSGKTTVASYFEAKGYFHINFDRVGREVVTKYPEILGEISEAFGPEYVPDGKLDRKKLGDLVFRNTSELEKLNGIFFKYIRNEALLLMTGRDNCILEGAVLFESGLSDYMDKIIYVKTDFDTAVERIVKRENISKQQAESRIAAQSKYDELEEKADHIIETNNSTEELVENIKKLFSRLKI
ncbi:MAG: dephospho-CoA kinase [Candidatus Delongbacteria bacterium]